MSPTAADYTDQERFLDAKLRAITAAGTRAIRHTLETYTAQTDPDESALHATEVRGSGWLVSLIADPATWTDDDERRLVESLRALQATDYRRESELGRFLAGEYHVR